MSMLELFASPVLFTAVMAGTLIVMLHISIRNEGWRPAFRQYRLRRALLVSLVAWSLIVLLSYGH